MNLSYQWLIWLKKNFIAFVREKASKPQYDITSLYECRKSGAMRASIRLSGRHMIEKDISEIITDNEFLEGLNKKTIRTLTYLATLEQSKPDYSVVMQRLGEEADDYILELRSKKNKAVVKTTATEILKDKSLLSKLSAIDANRIGYLAGVKETTKEFKLKTE